MNKLTRYEALLLAVEIVGSQQAFADLHSVSQPTVWRWLNQSKQLPAEYVLKTEAETGVSRHLLRPDIYPCEDPAVVEDDADQLPLFEPSISPRAIARHGNLNAILPGKDAA